MSSLTHKMPLLCYPHSVAKRIQQKLIRQRRREARERFFENWKHGQELSFERFMSAALYDENFGYYTTNIKEVGRGGDFSTSATLNDDLGAAISKWLVQELERKNHFKFQWHCVEAGAGNGSLAKAIFKNLPFKWRVNCTYHIVEKSPALVSVQKEKLKKVGRFKWHPDMDSLLRATKCFHFICNELVDAFPATLFQWDSNHIPCPSSAQTGPGRWMKLYLDFDGHSLFQKLRPVSSHELDGISTISELPLWPNQKISHGQRCEVHLTYREWLYSWIPRMKEGSLLTIDYGDRFPDVYKKHFSGTIRGYFQHQHINGNEIYSRVGEQDITADVNFSDLEKWSKDLSLENVEFQNQEQFLEKFGIVNDSYDSDHARSAYLKLKEGPGTAFKVLSQRKNSLHKK